MDQQREAGLPLSARERECLETTPGFIFDLQRYSLHDGPGLRTNVFFKGCPLRCGWCANPESHGQPPEIAVFAANCIRCGQFGEPCPDGWQPGAVLDRLGYRARAEFCPGGGVRLIGEQRSAGSILAEVRRDAVFYQGIGGMTLTGGEPTAQPAFAGALLRLAKADCIHTALETSGHCPWPSLERLLPHLDAILFDVKHVDSAVHRAHTGVGNETILANLCHLAALNAPVIVRVPVIPGFNATRETIRAIGVLVAEIGGPLRQVDLLPYHALARAKYAALARSYPWQDQPRLSEETVDSCAAELRGLGLTVSIGG